jgi:hypothetical protein
MPMKMKRTLINEILKRESLEECRSDSFVTALETAYEAGQGDARPSNKTKLLEAIFDYNSWNAKDYAYVGESVPWTLKGAKFPVLEFIKKLPGANFFNGKKVAACLMRLIREGKIASFRFGREYSECLYVTVSLADHGTCNPEVLPGRAKQIMNALKRVKADELHLNGTEIRAWWD